MKIIVATHKKYWMPKDNIYMPIHVGKYGKKDIGFKGDDTGQNISSKNPNYCELTGIYWAWKNLNDVDYIGLSHYRRHFTVKNFITLLFKNKRESVLTKSELKDILKKYDVVLPNKRRYYIETNCSHYNHAHNPDDLKRTEEIIKKFYPEYSKYFDKIMGLTYAHMFNMFIMKKNIFDSYCNWLFSVLEKLEKDIDVSTYNDYEARVFGFISELLMDVWIEKNSIEYKEIKVIYMENQNWFEKIKNFIVRKFSGGPFSQNKGEIYGNK